MQGDFARSTEYAADPLDAARAGSRRAPGGCTSSTSTARATAARSTSHHLERIAAELGRAGPVRRRPARRRRRRRRRSRPGATRVVIGTAAFADAVDARRAARGRAATGSPWRSTCATAGSRPAAGRSAPTSSRARGGRRSSRSAASAASSTRTSTATGRSTASTAEAVVRVCAAAAGDAGLIYSGGIGSLDDLRALAALGLDEPRGRDRRQGAVRGPLPVAEARAALGAEARHERPEAGDPVPRRRQGARREGHQLRRPARRRRPGRAGRALRRRGRRRAGVPRHHGLARGARHDRAAGAPHGRQRLHPVHDRRRHPLARGRAGGARRRRRQGVGQLGRGRAAGADGGAGRHVRRPVRRARDRREARRTSGFEVYVNGGRVATGSGRGRVGARGRRAGSGGDPAHEHGPRRHRGRLRPRADRARSRRRSRSP